MKKTRTHCPNCSTEYEYRARVCNQCGRKRDQLVIDTAIGNTANNRNINPAIINNEKPHTGVDRVTTKNVSMAQHSVNLANQSNQHYDVSQSEPGVTYRPRNAKSIADSTRTRIYVLGTFGSFILLFIVIGGFRSLYEATKPKVRFIPPKVVQRSPSAVSEPVSNAELEHIRFMRAKNARDLRESTAYTRALADKAAEAQRLEEERQVIEGLRVSKIVHTGRRGGQYVMTSSSNRRYVSGSSSSTAKSGRVRGRRK